MADFFYMDGHDLYVWLAYGVTLFLLLGLVIHSLLRHSKVQKTLRALTKGHAITGDPKDQSIG